MRTPSLKGWFVCGSLKNEKEPAVWEAMGRQRWATVKAHKLKKKKNGVFEEQKRISWNSVSKETMVWYERHWKKEDDAFHCVLIRAEVPQQDRPIDANTKMMKSYKNFVHDVLVKICQRPFSWKEKTWRDEPRAGLGAFAKCSIGNAAGVVAS